MILTFRNSFLAISFAAFLILPHSVLAQGGGVTTIVYNDFSPIFSPLHHTELAQNPTCELKEPHRVLLGLEAEGPGTIVIDKPGDKLGYVGIDQPTRWFLWTGDIPTVYFCDPSAEEKELDEVLGGQVLDKELSTAESTLIYIINRVIWIVAMIGAFFLWIATQLLVPVLRLSSFITHPAVTNLWPFMQGLANIGFILALLFIAFASVLQIESWNWRKLLPRLLVAALLINFSLIISGVIIDASRLTMAAFLRIANVGTLDTMARDILEGSTLIQGVFDTSTLSGIKVIASDSSWESPKNLLLATLLIWTLGVSMLILSVGLLIRYIMLILLLIVSPLAYLGYALPAAQGMAEKWWKSFISYVLYGPVAILLLVMLVIILNRTPVNNFFNGNGAFENLMVVVIDVLLVAIFTVGAAIAGKQLGTMGAGATFDFVKNRGKQVARGAGALAIAPVARPIQQRLEARKDYKKKQADIRKKYYGKKAGYDDKLKAYEQKWGTTKQKDQAAAAQAAGQGITQARATGDRNAIRTAVSNGAVSGAMLRQGHVTDAMNKNDLMTITEHGSEEQITAMMNNPKFMQSLSASEQIQFQQNVRTNIERTARQKETAIQAQDQRILATFTDPNERAREQVKQDQARDQRQDKTADKIASLINTFQQNLNKKPE